MLAKIGLVNRLGAEQNQLNLGFCAQPTQLRRQNVVDQHMQVEWHMAGQACTQKEDLAPPGRVLLYEVT